MIGTETRKKIPYAEQLVGTYKRLEAMANEVSDLGREVMRFLNRELFADYSLDSRPEDPYALKTVRMPSVVTGPIYVGTDASLSDLLESQTDLIRASLEMELELAERSTKVVAGKGMGSGGDDALYAAWQMNSGIRPNLYLIVSRSARYGKENMWLLEGDLGAFLSAESIGRMPRSDSEEEMRTFKNRVTQVEKRISLEEFGDSFREALNSGIIRYES